jgi:hypothetical protein
LQVRALARVEGEGALRVVVEDGRVERAELRIYEPPRFFEAFLRGRQHTEVTDLTSRICGICPIAYQTCGWQAMEQVCGVVVDEQIAALRRLLYCGEWISSHALHIYLLHAPDFLGYQDAIAMAENRREILERGLHLKKAGNAILETVGGRAIHPVNTRVGGFHRAPTKAELGALAYSRAKDEMFVQTDTAESPWYVVEAEDKRRARINMIAHLLSSIPYRDVERAPLTLPARPKAINYVRPPRELYHSVPRPRRFARMTVQSLRPGRWPSPAETPDSVLPGIARLAGGDGSLTRWTRSTAARSSSACRAALSTTASGPGNTMAVRPVSSHRTVYGGSPFGEAIATISARRSCRPSVWPLTTSHSPTLACILPRPPHIGCLAAACRSGGHRRLQPTAWTGN